MAANRQFHKDASSQYVLPNDTREQAELNEQARHLENLINVLHAPVSNSHSTKLLDVGCGTGYVSYKLATSFPNAEVFGLDVSDVPQLQQATAALNVHFVRGNVLTDTPTSWKQQDGGAGIAGDAQEFDLVFSRLLLNGMNDWPGYAKRVFDMLKPGAWIEVQELDAIVLNSEGEHLGEDWEWYTKCRERFQSKGLDFCGGSSVHKVLKQAGFADVQVIPYRLPLGRGEEQNAERQQFAYFWEERWKNVFQVFIERLLDDNQTYQKQMRKDLSLGSGRYTELFVTIAQRPD